MNKELPKNIEAEKCLLGSMFWSRESLQRGCEEADKDIFYLDSHGKIFDAIKSLYLNDTPVDITSVTTYLININKIIIQKYRALTDGGNVFCFIKVGSRKNRSGQTPSAFFFGG